VQVANAKFWLLRDFFLHLPFTFVHLIKFIGKINFVLLISALLLAAKRYASCFTTELA